MTLDEAITNLLAVTAQPWWDDKPCKHIVCGVGMHSHPLIQREAWARVLKAREDLQRVLKETK
jgi:endonuclease III-like uncharacterized protein